MITTLESVIKQDESDYQVLSVMSASDLKDIVRRVREMLIAYQAMGCITAEVRVILIPESQEEES